MIVKDALRRIKRQFGDEANVVIHDQDIYDWIYDAELDVIRAIADNDKTLQIPATSFPVSVPDSVNIKRLAVNGVALTYSSVSELDLNKVALTSKAGLCYWYRAKGTLNLWPVAEDSDTSVVEVTYVKTPAPMYNAAPYLNFSRDSQVFQYALIGSNPDWRSVVSVCVDVDMSLGFLNQPNVAIVAANGGTTVADLHFNITYPGTTGQSIALQVGDGSTTISSTMNFLTPVVAGERFKFRVSYQAATTTFRLYRFDEDGNMIIQATDDRAGTFSKITTGQANLYIGSFDGINRPAASPDMKIYDLRVYSNFNGTVSVMHFDGSEDFDNIGVVTGQMNLTTSSGHVLQTHGGIVDAPDNEFTVPEVYHEDIVKYCLARAHAKNMNFKASESEMEQYDRRVSTRRNEAQAPEIPLYKVHDPFDYDNQAEYYGLQ